MKKVAITISTLSLASITMLSGLILTSTHIFADDDSVTSTASVTVPVSCIMSGSVDSAHTATLSGGTYSGASGSAYENGIGKTTLTAYCNDSNGFSIYAIGFTGDSYDGENHTKLVGANTNLTINTGVYSSGDTTSKWSMKVTKVENPQSGDPVTFDPQNMSIQNSFSDWHVVPDTYTKVAQYKASTGSSATDTALGAKVETTYAAYISTTQAADTYTGKVKYTMVHPYDHNTPTIPPAPISQCTTKVPGVTYMQDVTSENLASVLSSMEMNQQYFLRDKRDETPYCVAKLDDGSQTGTLWMTQNLRIQGTISASLSNFEGEDFNVSQYDLKTDGTTNGECFSNNGYNNVCSHTPESTEIPSGKTAEVIGAWYNYMAATAGTISGSSNSNEAASDICPANWHLPDYDEDNIVGSINSVKNASLSAKSAFTPAIGGYYLDGSIGNTNYGYWWSSKSKNASDRYYLYSANGSSSFYTYQGTRSNSFYIRCVR